MKVLLIFFICFLSFGCGSKVIIDESEDYIKVIKEDINVYDDVYIEDMLEIANEIEVTSKNIKINTEKLGKMEYTIEYILEGKLYSKKVTFNVKDMIAPIVFSGTNKTVTVGYNKDICNLITYGDNFDGNIKCVIEGNYDLNTAGTYKLVYHLIDSSGNETKTNVNLNVQAKSNSNSSTTTKSEKTKFSDIYKSYKTDNNEIGIDVSKWQGDIDFAKVKAAGATFVMMRIGVQTSQNESLSIDKYFEQNIKNAKEAGLKVGVYLYSIATSQTEAKKEAQWVIKTLNKEKLDLPIAFDWENWTNWNSYKISFHEINLIADTFIKEVQNNGYTGMLYSSKFYLETIWDNKSEFPVWLAHYTQKTSYKGNYLIWQLCNNGQIEGIEGDVDIDILYY